MYIIEYKTYKSQRWDRIGAVPPMITLYGYIKKKKKKITVEYIHKLQSEGKYITRIYKEKDLLKQYI